MSCVSALFKKYRANPFVRDRHTGNRGRSDTHNREVTGHRTKTDGRTKEKWRV